MILCVLIIGHLVADFFLQSNSLSEKKAKYKRFLLLHSLIYGVIIATINFCCLSLKFAIISTIIISISHLFVDFLKNLLERNAKKHNIQLYTFLFDQLIHVSIIAIIYFSFKLSSHYTAFFKNIESNSIFTNIVLYVLLAAIILDPTAVLIKKVFIHITNDTTSRKKETNTQSKDSSHSNDINAGNLIGKLERTIVSVLILIGQYGVIGLVLTAKSIARFKQLEDKDFAERYLVGTLLSMLISVITTLVVKEFLV